MTKKAQKKRTMRAASSMAPSAGVSFSQVIVIGAGASGLIAAVMAAREGAQVLVLEGQKSTGKKLLMTGNGKCNLTSLDPDLPRAYHSSEPERLKVFSEHIFSGFSVEDTLSFFEQIGVPLRSRGNYVYPCSGQSTGVHSALLLELERLHVRIKCANEVLALSWSEGRSLWQVFTDGWTYEAARVILSAGSAAVPATGSDGSGYRLAQACGHCLAPVRPVLTGLKVEDPALKIAAGARTVANVRVYAPADSCNKADRPPGQGAGSRSFPEQAARPKADSCPPLLTDNCGETASGMSLQTISGRETDFRVIFDETGEVQWTPEGISGVVIFNSSLYVSELLEHHPFVQMELDLLPEWPQEKTMRMFRRWAEGGTEYYRRMMLSALNSRVMAHLEQALLRSADETPATAGSERQSQIPPRGSKGASATAGNKRQSQIQPGGSKGSPDTSGSEMDGQIRPLSGRESAGPEQWARIVKHLPVVVTGTRGFDQCQSCSGGVLLSQVDPGTCESLIRKDLYLTGEMLDAVGPCGGYNLQWAWSTGAAAGRAAGRKAAGEIL